MNDTKRALSLLLVLWLTLLLPSTAWTTAMSAPSDDTPCHSLVAAQAGAADHRDAHDSNERCVKHCLASLLMPKDTLWHGTNGSSPVPAWVISVQVQHPAPDTPPPKYLS